MIEIPDLPNITEKVAATIVKNYPRYGNSWVNNKDFEFWKQRARAELVEAIEAPTNKDCKHEILDLIAVLTMWYENLET